MTATILSLVISIAAILIAIAAFVYTRRQTVLMEEQESRRQREDQSTAEWANKFDEAVGHVLRIVPRRFPKSLDEAYLYIFTDALRQRIETYLTYRDPEHRNDHARQPSGELLRMPIVQQTIQEVLERVEKLKQAEPENWEKLGLG